MSKVHYPAEHAARKIAKDIDWEINKAAWGFRTRLRAGFKAGPNFNGHFYVVEFGCGSPCQVQVIIDVETGKVLGRHGGATSYGAAYRLSSSLIAADLPEPDAEWNDYTLLRYSGPKFFSRQEWTADPHQGSGCVVRWEKRQVSLRGGVLQVMV